MARASHFIAAWCVSAWVSVLLTQMIRFSSTSKTQDSIAPRPFSESSACTMKGMQDEGLLCFHQLQYLFRLTSLGTNLSNNLLRPAKHKWSKMVPAWPRWCQVPAWPASVSSETAETAETAVSSKTPILMDYLLSPEISITQISR